MGRRLFTCAAIVSLLLCAGAGALWVRSYRMSDQVVWRWQWAYTTGGRLVVAVNRVDWPPGGPNYHRFQYTREAAHPFYNGLRFLNYDSGDSYSSRKRCGFAWHQRREASGNRMGIAIVPFWSIALATGALPIGWMLGRWRARPVARRRRDNPHLCPACGYDRRATPGRCSECGATAG